ncbi:hypothetical protein LINPERHAP2_LOCUS39169 [Linum perenne]
MCAPGNWKKMANLQFGRRTISSTSHRIRDMRLIGNWFGNRKELELISPGNLVRKGGLCSIRMGPFWPTVAR